MKTSSKAPRRNDPKGLRSRILDVTADLFQAHGYSGTTMQELLKTAGVTGGAFHHHFRSKKELGLAVVRERIAPTVRETWISPVRAAPSLAAGISRVFEDIAAGIDKRRRVSGCPLNNLALELVLVDTDFRAVIESVFAEWRAALGARIGESRGGSRLDRLERANAATFIIATYSGAMTQAKTLQGAVPLRSAAEELLYWVRERGFATKTTGATLND